MIALSFKLDLESKKSHAKAPFIKIYLVFSNNCTILKRINATGNYPSSIELWDTNSQFIARSYLLDNS